MRQLRRQAERQGVPPDSPLAAAVEELGHTVEELTVALEQLEVANEELATARQAAERHALRYQALFRSTPDAYLVSDERGVIREANRAAEAKLGREARHLEGKPLVVFLAKEHWEAFERQLLAIQQGNRLRSADWEARFAPRNAEPFWAAVTADATPADGVVREIRWLLRDVTERRRGEEALRASEGRLRLMADSLPVLISYVDREECFRFNNAAHEAWFGIPREKLFGKHLREVLGQAVHDRTREQIARVLAGQQVRFEDDIPAAGGATRRVSILYAPHVGDSGEVLGFYSLVADLSEQMRMQQQLRAAVAATALAEDRERRRLAEDLHDDLGQLLSLIGMKLGVLRDSAAGGSAEGDIRAIEELVLRAHAHTESLTFQLSPPILHDQGFAPAAEWLAEDLTRSYGLQVELADDGQPKPLDEATRVALFRTLRELLINVARHAGTQHAYVRIWREGDRVRLQVRDHGSGFDPSGASEGFGLLSARERLCNLGGSLEIRSVPEEGACITAEVPVAGSGRQAP
jgi:PAS domain S-box-containing protein